MSRIQHGPRLKNIIEDPFEDVTGHAKSAAQAKDRKDKFYDKEQFVTISEEKNWALKQEVEGFSHIAAMEEVAKEAALRQAEYARREREAKKNMEELKENGKPLQDTIKLAVQGLSELQQSIFDDSRAIKVEVDQEEVHESLSCYHSLVRENTLITGEKLFCSNPRETISFLAKRTQDGIGQLLLEYKKFAPKSADRKEVEDMIRECSEAFKEFYVELTDDNGLERDGFYSEAILAMQKDGSLGRSPTPTGHQQVSESRSQTPDRI